MRQQCDNNATLLTMNKFSATIFYNLYDCSYEILFLSPITPRFENTKGCGNKFDTDKSMGTRTR